MMDSTAIAEFVCWTELGIAKGYKYFVARYEGDFGVPKKKSVWARFDSYKKAQENQANLATQEASSKKSFKVGTPIRIWA